jgi:hypothetical protein
VQTYDARTGVLIGSVPKEKDTARLFDWKITAVAAFATPSRAARLLVARNQDSSGRLTVWDPEEGEPLCDTGAGETHCRLVDE